MNTPVDILVLADRDERALAPLTDALPPPLLPVGGKPMLAHLLETLSTCVTAKVTIVLAGGDRRTAAWLENRGFPRLTIQFGDQPAPVVARDMLAFRGDILISPTEVRRFVTASLTGSAPLPESCPGAWRLRAGDLAPTWRHTAMMADQADSTAPSIAAYHRLNIAAAQGAIPGLKLAGWIGEDGIRAGVDTQILTRRAPGRNILVGNGVYIEKHVILGDNVVIGDGCVIARGAVLKNTVILPGGYVGRGLEINDAVVSSPWLWRAGSGKVTRIEDPTLLGRLAA